MKNIIAYIVLGVILAGLGGLCYYQWDANRKTVALLALKNEELQKVNLEIGRAHTQIVSEKQAHNAAMIDMDKKIKDEIKKRNALVTLYAQLEAKYNASQSLVATQAATIEELSKATSIAEMASGTLYYKNGDSKLVEVKQIKWSWGDFRLELAGETTTAGLDPATKTIKINHAVSYKLNMKFKARFVEAKVPGGAINHYAELYEMDDKGNTIGQLKLTSFEVLKSEDLKPRWQGWNPHLDLFAGATMSLEKKPRASFTADLGISISSIGVTKDDNVWRFFRFGIGYTEKNVSLSFSPAMYNLGKNLPLISNLWILPYAGYSFGLKAAILGMGMGVVF